MVSENIVPNTQPKGYNSFIATRPKQEYQIDLMQLSDLKDEGNRKFPYALVAIDIFDKYCSAIPIKSKQPPDVLAGIMEAVAKMHGKPEYIYIQIKKALFLSKIVQQYFKDEGIKHLTS